MGSADPLGLAALRLDEENSRRSDRASRYVGPFSDQIGDAVDPAERSAP